MLFILNEYIGKQKKCDDEYVFILCLSDIKVQHSPFDEPESFIKRVKNQVHVLVFSTSTIA